MRDKIANICNSKIFRFTAKSREQRLTGSSLGIWKVKKKKKKQHKGESGPDTDTDTEVH